MESGQSGGKSPSLPKEEGKVTTPAVLPPLAKAGSYCFVQALLESVDYWATRGFWNSEAVRGNQKGCLRQDIFPSPPLESMTEPCKWVAYWGEVCFFSQEKCKKATFIKTVECNEILSQLGNIRVWGQHLPTRIMGMVVQKVTFLRSSQGSGVEVHCLCRMPGASWRTYGSGVYIGLDEWRMYWVEWNTRKAKPPRKSRDDSRPATGRRRNPVQPWRKNKAPYYTLAECMFWQTWT